MDHFKQTVLPLKDKLYRLALHLVGHAADAEDLVQDVMVKAWTRREQLPELDSVEAYLVTTCQNLAFDRLRQTQLSSQETLDSAQMTAAHEATPLQSLSEADRQDWVTRLMNDLPEQQRLMMHLRGVEGQSYRDIAQLLGLSEENVKIQIFRVRQRLKERFAQVERYGL